MTNIEFLVDELRKAKEQIAALKVENTKLRDNNRALKARADRMYELLNKRTAPKVTTSDLDALAALRDKLSKS